MMAGDWGSSGGGGAAAEGHFNAKQTTRQAKASKEACSARGRVNDSRSSYMYNLILQGEVQGHAAQRAKDKTLSQLSRIKGRMKAIF